MKVPMAVVALVLCQPALAEEGRAGRDYSWRLEPAGYELVFGLDEAGHVYYRLPILHGFDDSGRSLEVLPQSSKRDGGQVLGILAETARPREGGFSRAALADHIRSLGVESLPRSAGSIDLFVFSATWCAPCHRLVEQFEQTVAAGSPVKIIVVEADLVKESNEVQVSPLAAPLNLPQKWHHRSRA